MAMEHSMADIQEKIREALQNGYGWKFSYTGKIPACNWCYQIGRLLSAEGCICLDKEHRFFIHHLQSMSISQIRGKANGIYLAKFTINPSVENDYLKALQQHQSNFVLEYSVPFKTELMKQVLLDNGWTLQTTQNDNILQSFSKFHNVIVFEKQDCITVLYYNQDNTPDFEVVSGHFNTVQYQRKTFD